jgi:hypothetical protein
MTRPLVDGWRGVDAPPATAPTVFFAGIARQPALASADID